MPTKKRTSASLDQDLDAAIAQDLQMAAAKHWIFRKLFPWYGAAINKLGNTVVRPPWCDTSEPMREIRMRADAEWCELTGLPTLDAYNPRRWFMVAVAAGYSLPEARRMPLERLRETIEEWALAKRVTKQKPPSNQWSDPMTKKDMASELGVTTVRSVNRMIEKGKIEVKPHGKLWRYRISGTS